MSLYLSIIAIQPPIDIGEINLRSVHSINYRALLKGNGVSQTDFPNVTLQIANHISISTSLTIGLDLFIGSATNLPQDKPVALVKLTGGYSNRQTHNGSKLFRPTFQILTYGGDYDESYSLANEIYDLLDGKHDLELTE